MRIPLAVAAMIASAAQPNAMKNCAATWKAKSADAVAAAVRRTKRA